MIANGLCGGIQSAKGSDTFCNVGNTLSHGYSNFICGTTHAGIGSRGIYMYGGSRGFMGGAYYSRMTFPCNSAIIGSRGSCNRFGQNNVVMASGYGSVCYASTSAVLATSSGNVSSVYNSVSSANQNLQVCCSCTFRVQNMQKASGSFLINHPDPEKNSYMDLKHSFVESPTAGDNIYRYKVITLSGSATIELPSYYKYLNTDDQVFVTPQGHFGTGYGTVNEPQTQVNVTSNLDGEYNVLLISTRKDWDALHAWNGVEGYR
jgi:hypothetical protein